MSMLVITGMEMPQICFMCRFCRKLWTEEGNFLSAECILTNDTLDQDDVNWFPYSCPLCEVPDWIPVWIPVKKRLPDSGVHVLVSCKSNGGCRYVCDAFYSAPKTEVCSYNDDIDMEYDEETDEYYMPEGWWEVIKNWDEYSCVGIEDTVTHWMPLPAPQMEE